MTRVNYHLADETSPVNGAVIGVITTIAMILAGFLSIVSFAAI